MNDLEVVKCCELENLVMKIQNLISNIEKGDLGLQFNFLMYFPYFKGEGFLELRKEAINEYYVMVQTAFENACKLIVEASVPAIIETVDCSVCHLNEILDSRIFEVRALPVTKSVFDLYNSANAKLLKAKQNQYAANLEELKKRIFMGWQIVE